MFDHKFETFDEGKKLLEGIGFQLSQSLGSYLVYPQDMPKTYPRVFGVHVYIASLCPQGTDEFEGGLTFSEYDCIPEIKTYQDTIRQAIASTEK